jgi:hypothetical protein
MSYQARFVCMRHPLAARACSTPLPPSSETHTPEQTWFLVSPPICVMRLDSHQSGHEPAQQHTSALNHNSNSHTLSVRSFIHAQGAPASGNIMTNAPKGLMCITRQSSTLSMCLAWAVKTQSSETPKLGLASEPQAICGCSNCENCLGPSRPLLRTAQRSLAPCCTVPLLMLHCTALVAAKAVDRERKGCCDCLFSSYHS